jgi:tripartite-type tricarboxylate transporter receptor subunit TctC
MRRRRFCGSLAALCAAGAPLAPTPAAEAFPTRPVRVISAYAAGGGPDLQLRQAAPTLGEMLSQPVVVENRVGAAGVLAAQYVAQQPPDGHTLLMGSNTHLIQKILQPELRFDPIADFAPVSNLATACAVLVVRRDGPYRTLRELVADVKARPDRMNYASGGIGTAAHLAGATLVALAGLKVTHIPLRGSIEIPGSLMREDTQFAFPVIGTALPQVRGGNLRALAVTSARRLPFLPQVPTLEEAFGTPLAVQESWFGIWAPARTPPSVLDVLNAAVARTARSPTVQSAFLDGGGEAVWSDSPSAFSAFIRDEHRKWAEIVKLAGLATVS